MSRSESGENVSLVLRIKHYNLQIIYLHVISEKENSLWDSLQHHETWHLNGILFVFLAGQVTEVAEDSVVETDEEGVVGVDEDVLIAGAEAAVVEGCEDL
ncbi:unnamed protein product [Allacma fusca]|uniref:Uncharacterized protein n=1 Tax=Allacma fusca TaxID=39272 RepID=A0A8J2P2D7_9HEXA|nr:unnamed protein product [Allacma fusca]